MNPARTSIFIGRPNLWSVCPPGWFALPAGARELHERLATYCAIPEVLRYS